VSITVTPRFTIASLWDQITRHPAEAALVYLGFWFVSTVMISFSEASAYIILSLVELVGGGCFIWGGGKERVWPWYGIGLTLAGLVTLGCTIGGFFDLGSVNDNLYSVLAVLPLLPLFLFGVFTATYESKWGMRQFGVALCRLLLLALQDEDAENRAEAARLLGRLEDPRAVDGLINALEDGASIVRAPAAVALGKIGEARALPALQRLIQDDYVDDDEYPVRYVAAVAIKRIQARQV
jgi:hypothetical protein